ncbi:MAG TPA: trimethylamine methyltransferase family protein [Dongiaceae bacterium]|jgi:trimethylamine--corrinoid protein Co-methyltransferase
MARESARRRERRAGSGVRQLPFAKLQNPFRQVEILSADQIEAIHRASLRLLENVGFEVLHDESLDIFQRAGAKVDRGSKRVQLDGAQVEELVAKAPPRFSLRARNRDHDVTIGEGHLIFIATGGPAFASDLDRGRRAGNYADMCDFIRLVQSLNVIHQDGGTGIEPTDLPPETRHLDVYDATLTLTDKTWNCWGLGAHCVRDAVAMTCLAYDVTPEQLAAEPALITIINSNSPMRLDGPMGAGLVEMARHGQAVVMTPFTLAGAMSPITLAGALTQQNAEALFLISLAQLVRPGTPVAYGGFTSNVDMRTGAPAFGTPEYTKAAMATGQLTRRYGIPYRSSNVNASNAVDAQATYESAMSIWGCLMGGVNLMEHAAGWLEGGLTASFEKLIVDAEMLQLMRETMTPLQVRDEDLGLDAIAEVGPGGHFFGTAHTLERFETAFYAPMLSDWRNFETWQESGSVDATRRANGIWKELLRQYEPPAMDPARREALTAYVTERKAEIASGKF